MTTTHNISTTTSLRNARPSALCRHVAQGNRHSMSVKVMALVWDHYPRGGGELLTALALADHADHGGQNVRPGITGLARKTRQSERTVQNHLAQMCEDRWLVPVRYLRGGYGHATEYRVNPGWISIPADFAPQPSGPIKETTTTTAAVAAIAAACPSQAYQAPLDHPGQDHDLHFPPQLGGQWLESAKQMIADCPDSHRQAVLDELAGVIAKKALAPTQSTFCTDLSKAPGPADLFQATPSPKPPDDKPNAQPQTQNSPRPKPNNQNKSPTKHSLRYARHSAPARLISR
jgi:hypothetical protein